MKTIFTENASKPGGHYSQAVVHNGLVYVSGQLPVKAGTGEKVTGPIEEQTLQTLKNVEEILKSSGSGLNKVLKVTVYVSDISLWDKVNKVYADYFGEFRPARAVVPTRNLHHGFLIEIEAVAYI